MVKPRKLQIVYWFYIVYAYLQTLLKSALLFNCVHSHYAQELNPCNVQWILKSSVSSSMSSSYTWTNVGS